MTIELLSADPASVEADVLIVPVFNTDVAGQLERYAEAFGTVVLKARDDVSGKIGDVVSVYTEKGLARRVLIVGAGEPGGLTAEQVRRWAAAGVRQAGGTTTIGMVIPETARPPHIVAEAVVEGALLGSYGFTQYRTTPEEGNAIEALKLVVASEIIEEARAGVAAGHIIASATAFARDLVNLAPGEKTATDLARFARESADRSGVRAEVWDKARIEAENMGGLLAVNRGSEEPPTFTLLEWKPEHAVNERPIVFVGKGVVYDTGGLSLKPTKGSMDHMKYDMAGAAAVLGATEAIARLSLPVHLITLVPATDNRPGRHAYVPGEVVKMHSGLTVEVLNTDAEGRMLLADALSYARRFDPEWVVDLATLTGAQRVALGDLAAAILTSETDGAADRLARFQAAGDHTGDRVAPLPMYAEYADALKSDIADLKNIGGRWGGTITAAKFLEHFIDYPWVHLDIAGPAFMEKTDGYRPKGASGYGVRLLVEVVRRYVADRQDA